MLSNQPPLTPFFVLLHPPHSLPYLSPKNVLAKGGARFYKNVKENQTAAKFMRRHFAIISMSVLSKPGISPNRLQYQEFVFRGSSACVCVSAVTDDISLDLRLSALAASAFPVFCSVLHSHTHSYKHVHAPLVSCYPVLPSPVTLSSWCCLSDSSWFAWVSVVTAQRPAPGDSDLSALSES